MKRVAKIGLKVAGCIVAAIALLTGSTMLVLRTSWGSERLRRVVVSRVNDQIQGHFDIARLTFGGDRLALRGVQLRDPQGHLVADVAGVDVAFSIPRLVRREVRVICQIAVRRLLCARSSVVSGHSVPPTQALDVIPVTARTASNRWA